MVAAAAKAGDEERSRFLHSLLLPTPSLLHNSTTPTNSAITHIAAFNLHCGSPASTPLLRFNLIQLPPHSDELRSQRLDPDQDDNGSSTVRLKRKCQSRLDEQQTTVKAEEEALLGVRPCRHIVSRLLTVQSLERNYLS